MYDIHNGEIKKIIEKKTCLSEKFVINRLVTYEFQTHVVERLFEFWRKVYTYVILNFGLRPSTTLGINIINGRSLKMQEKLPAPYTISESICFLLPCCICTLFESE